MLMKVKPAPPLIKYLVQVAESMNVIDVIRTLARKPGELFEQPFCHEG
jgi:hypothetical protein